MNRINYFFLFLLLLLVLIVFKSWFFSPTISGGDLDYVWNYNNYSIYPYAWNIKLGQGLGTNFIPFLWIYFSVSTPIVLIGKVLNVPWDIAQKFIFFYPFLLLSFFSSIYFVKKVLSRITLYFLPPLIFVFNTYILSLLQGGQVVLAIAYCISFFVLGLFISNVQGLKLNLKNLITLGLVLALLFLLDIRVGYMVTGLIFLYSLIEILISNNKLIILKTIFVNVSIAYLITILLNLFWLLPTAASGSSSISTLGDFTNSNSLSFFSFAKMENTISLLHPNWPENIFGKVGFMKPEFLVIPLMAFSAFFLIANRKDSKIVGLFSLISLIGAFLAKGTNEPFGNVYTWLFNNVPGFILFRDPTKWYFYVLVGYLILITYSVERVFKIIMERISNK